MSQLDSGCLRNNDVILDFWCFKSADTSLFQQLLKVNKKKTLKLRFTGLVEGGFSSQMDGNAWDIYSHDVHISWPYLVDDSILLPTFILVPYHPSQIAVIRLAIWEI